MKTRKLLPGFQLEGFQEPFQEDKAKKKKGSSAFY